MLMQQKRIKKLNQFKLGDQEKKVNFISKRYWTTEQDNELSRVISIVGTKWKQVSLRILGRTPSQCSQRWKKIKPKSEKQRTVWTEEDDIQIHQLVKEIGFKWEEIAREFDFPRTGRQIRERYMNQIHPSIERKPWSKSEDILIWNEYQKIGSRWVDIAKRLKGRTGNMVKNRFNLFVSREYGNIPNAYQQCFFEEEKPKLQPQQSETYEEKSVKCEVFEESQLVPIENFLNLGQPDQQIFEDNESNYIN